jgi:peroxiredoxin
MKQIVRKGERFPSFNATNIHGANVSVPDQNQFIHLQFRRFAGCPICNLHLRSFVRRHNEIRDAGVREVVIFHSGDDELLPFQGSFPFDIIGDPEKRLYRQYGVETSIFAIVNPAAWPAMIKGNLAKSKPSMKRIPKGGPLGLPADFLIAPDGNVLACQYGSHAYDQWSVDDLLNMVRR